MADLDSYTIGSHNCADGKSWIKIKHGGNIHLTRIEDLAKEVGLTDGKLADVSNDCWQILSRDGWTKLKNISQRKLKEDEELYTIKTKAGLPIRLTGEHRLPILDENGEEKVVKVKDLKVGESLLDIEKVALSEKEMLDGSYLNLLKFNDDTLNLKVTAYSNTVYEAKNYTKLYESLQLFTNFSNLVVRSKGSRYSYPLLIPHTPQLAKLYAYIHVLGEIKGKSIVFSDEEENVIDDLIECYETVFGVRLKKDKLIKVTKTKITDRLIVKLFTEGNKSIPNFVLNGSEDLKLAYLAGLGIGYNRIFTVFHEETYAKQLVQLIESLGYQPNVHFFPEDNLFGVTLNDSKVMSEIKEKSDDLKRKDTYVCRRPDIKDYVENRIVSISTSHEDCSVYDMETASHWYIINNYVSHNCLTIPFDELLASGFNTRQTDVRPANSINTALQLVAVIFQLQSLQQFGRQNCLLSPFH